MVLGHDRRIVGYPYAYQTNHPTLRSLLEQSLLTQCTRTPFLLLVIQWDRVNVRSWTVSAEVTKSRLGSWTGWGSNTDTRSSCRTTQIRHHQVVVEALHVPLLQDAERDVLNESADIRLGVLQPNDEFTVYLFNSNRFSPLAIEKSSG